MTLCENELSTAWKALHCPAVLWCEYWVPKAPRREYDEPGVGRGLLEGIGREQCRSLGLERGRRPFCQMKGGSSREKRVLEVWQVAGQCRDMRSGCSPATSTALCLNYCPCKKVSSFFWAAGARGQQISASQGEGWGRAVDGDENKIIKIFLRIASAPIHLQLWKKVSPQSSESPRETHVPLWIHSLSALCQCTMIRVHLHLEIDLVAIKEPSPPFLMCSDSLAPVCLHRMNRGVIRAGTAFPQVITRF